MGPPSATLYLPDDADLLAFANVPGVNINYVMKNSLLVFASDVYRTALKIMGEEREIDVNEIPSDIYRAAIRTAASHIQQNKDQEADTDFKKTWSSRCVITEGFVIPVPREISSAKLSDMKAHCHLSPKSDRLAIRLWKELRAGQKSAFVKRLIRAYMERPIFEPMFFEDRFPYDKVIATGTSRKRKPQTDSSAKDVQQKTIPKPKKESAKPAAEPTPKPAQKPVPTTQESQSEEAFDLFSSFAGFIM